MAPIAKLLLSLTVAVLLLPTFAAQAGQCSVTECQCQAPPERNCCSASGCCGNCREPTRCQCGCGSLLCASPTLTGDWHGLRPCLQKSGVTFRGSVTQFGFGVRGGTQNPVPAPLGLGDTFKYTGRGEYDLIFDLEKFGGLPKGKLLVGAQHWYGQFGNVSLNTGAFPPAVFAASLPPEINDQGVPFITDFLLTQPLSEKLVVFAGKKNVIGSADQDLFAGGDGTNQFINQSLIANPAFLLALPYSSFTAGVAMPQTWGMISAYIYDPQVRTRDFFKLDDLFSKGIIIGGEVKANTNFFCKPGEHHIGGIWKKIDLVDISRAPPPPIDYPYPPVPPGVPTKSDSYTIYYGFDQYFQVYSDEPRRGWGMFARASISDANPTPFRFFLSGGIGGDSRLRCDRGDTFGLGWYYTGISGEFGPLPQALFAPRNGSGVEAFYNFQVTSWLNVTPDVQYIRPEISTFGKDALVYGVRVNMKL